MCLPRYECDSKQKSSLGSTPGDVGLVEKTHFKSSYLLKEVIRYKRDMIEFDILTKNTGKYLSLWYSSFKTGSFQSSKNPINLPNYGLLDLPTEQEEQEQESILINNIGSDLGDSQFSFEAVVAENDLVEESENMCAQDQSDYCRGNSAAENTFKSPNHTMCKYCVSS